MSNINIEDLKIIVSRSGGMVLDTQQIPIEELKILASRAASSKASIILTNIQHINVEDLKIIASRGKGCVIFDFVNIK